MKIEFPWEEEEEVELCFRQKDKSKDAREEKE